MALKRLCIVIGAALLGLPGCSDPPPPSAPTPRSVETFEVRSSAGRPSPVYSGTLRAKQRSDLSFLRSGQVLELTKELGEAFSRGERLARIDGTELSLAIDEFAANLQGALAERADAQSSHDRFMALDGTGAVSRSDVDTAVARLQTSKARVASIEASIAQARKRLAETILEAPYDGQVVERLVEPSQSVAAGQPVYRVIGDEGGLEAVVNLPAPALDLFAEGHRTELLVRPSGVVRLATVTEVGNAAGVSGLYPVTLALADSAGLRPGLRVEVPGQSEAPAAQIPSIPLTAYLAAPGDRGHVFLVDPQTARVSIRKVQLGELTDEGIEVLSGLDIGALIVSRGLPSLRDGDIVSPTGLSVRQFNE